MELRTRGIDNDDFCIEWYGKVNSCGRAHVRHPITGAKVLLARLVNQTPSSLTTDHLCRNKACIRYDHLESVSHRENVVRGKSSILAAECRKCGRSDRWWTGPKGRICLECNKYRKRVWRAVRSANAAV